MKIITEPKVFLVGETQIVDDGIQDYLNHINASHWRTDASTDVELLCEFYGRSCYESWDTEHNLNITRVREGNKNYIKNIIKSGHGSVLEHTWLNWMMADVSRVFTHELVRHRVGTAISQQSQRYVRHKDVGFYMPSDMQEIFETSKGKLTIQNIKDAKGVLIETVDYLENQSRKLTEILKVDDSPFDIKKRLTTIIRRILPNGVLTDIGWSCNIRTLRHVLELRTSRHSEEEIRRVFGIVGDIVMKRYVNLFGDYKMEIVNGLPEFTTEFSKV